MKTSYAGFASARRVVLLGSAAVLGFALPAVAHAQVAEEAQPATDSPIVDEGTGNEIVVTATKREQTLQDVPVAVSVTTADTIERAQIRDIKDLVSIVPSLRVTQLQSSASTYFIIRGFGNGANNPGLETSVAVFVDGVYRSRSASQISDLPDISRIEVLRGPQSTLFGKNASAGVISLVTKKPQFTFGGNVEASYGNYNAMVLKGVVTGPLSETIAASVAGGYNKRDGYVTDVGYGGKVNERNRWFLRGQLLFEPSNELKVRLIADYDKIDEVCCAVHMVRNSNPVVNALTGRTTATPDPFDDIIGTNFPSSNKIKNYGFSGQIDYEMGPLTLTSITAYRRNRTQTAQDSDFSARDFLGRNDGDIGLKTFTQELRLATNLDGPLNALVGAYYYNEDVKYDNVLTFGKDFRSYVDIATQGGLGLLETLVLNVPLGTFSKPGQGAFDSFRMKDKSYSLFGNIDFEVTDRLTLTAGVNYTDDRKTVRSNSVSTDAFSALDLIGIGNTVIKNTVIATQVGNILSLGRLATAAEIGAFATSSPTNGAIYGQVVTGAAAYADLNQTNPAVNSLLALKPLQFLPPFLNIPNAVESGKVHDTDWSYTLRASYEISDSLNAYVSYATGYKPSSYNLSRDSRPAASDLAAIRAVPGLATPNLTTGSRFARPEKSKVYEFGLKANWGLVTLNFAAFKQIINNFQSNVFTGTGFALATAGKQSAYGFELEGTARPTRELTLTAGLTHLNPKYDDFCCSALGNASGTRPAGIPAISATFGAMWDHTLDNDDHIILRGDYHYESRVQITEGLPYYITRDLLGNVVTYQTAFDAARPYTREVSDLNASLTYALHTGLELSIWGRNLLDKRTLASVFDVPAQTLNIAGYPSQPLTWGGAVRFRW